MAVLPLRVNITTVLQYSSTNVSMITIVGVAWVVVFDGITLGINGLFSDNLSTLRT